MMDKIILPYYSYLKTKNRQILSWNSKPEKANRWNISHFISSKTKLIIFFVILASVLSPFIIICHDFYF